MENCITDFRNCMKCILKNIGATVMGVKPAELRTVQFSEHGVWERCKKTISSYQQIKFIELYDLARGKKVLFYHHQALDQQLRRPEVLNFLQQLGYPSEYDLESYVSYLVDRLQRDDFPHEIGIFFGYPLKDVLGFMGYLDLESTYTSEWKFYGNQAVSLAKKKKFEEARSYFIEQLDNLEQVEEFDKVV